MLKRWKEAVIGKMRGRKRDRGYYVSHFTTSELRRLLREAKHLSKGSDSEVYEIREISAALTRREWDEQ